MSELMNESADIFNEDDKNKPKPHIIVTIFKIIGITIILLIVLGLFYRCAEYGNPPFASKVLMNEAFVDKYNEDPDSVVVRQYAMPKFWYEIKDGRLVELNMLYHIPATHQLQVTIKYNEDIVPDGVDVDRFPFVLGLIDENGNVFSDYWMEKAKKGRFRYARVCFEGVDIETGELDENGNPLRHSYKLALYMIKPDGTCEYEYTFDMYNTEDESSATFKVIPYKVKK